MTTALLAGRAARRLGWLAYFAVLIAMSPGAALGQDRFRLDLPGLTFSWGALQALTVRLGQTDGEVRIGQLVVGERRYENLVLRCEELTLEGMRLRCGRGQVRAADLLDRATLDFDLDFATLKGEFALRADGGGELTLELRGPDGFDLLLQDLSIAALGALHPDLVAYGASGRVSARVSGRPESGAQHVQVHAVLEDGAFSSADGLHAGEALRLEVDATGSGQAAGAWRWQGRLAWVDGATYLHPLFIQSGPVIEFSARHGDEAVELEHAALTLEGVEAVELRGRLSLPDLRVIEASGAIARADLAHIGPNYLTPVIAPARVDSLRYAGYLSAGFEFRDERLQLADVALDSVGVSDTAAELSFGPVSGLLPWRRGESGSAWLDSAGGRWQKLALGPFQVRARVSSDAIDFERVVVPVLDGRLVLSELALRHDASGWHGTGGAVVEPISMPLLTEAIGLPSMSGLLSASMPRLTITPGALALEGALVISVFDGYLQITNLNVREPFGVGSLLYADVEARHLDLFKLSETFSFGSITGFIDADVLGLELAHWNPVRFDATIRSSPGRYRKRISQRAVENISSLGGAGAVAAIQRGMLSLFESFGYSQIGLSCRLEGSVCVMGGLDDEQQGSFAIIRGGGIPSLDVMGYNRRVDWVELLDRIERVVESNTPPVIE